MVETTEPLVVGVRFSSVGKIYHFVADRVDDVKVGDNVVVETSRGWQLGFVAQIVPDPKRPPEGWKSIDRRATPRDLLLRQMWQMKEAEVVTKCRSRAAELRLNGIKIISAEYSFDGSRLSIFFSSETEEKYDLKSLRSDMQKAYAPSQVEMRQIGPRDVAKSVCGMGACGLERRCCCMFLTDFSSISIRMAKEQGISLTPTEITGMCGRLRCCLIYEYDTYVEARSRLPKRNKHVKTPQGEGKVVDVIPLRGAVIVDLPEVGYREFNEAEVQVLDGSGESIPPTAQPGPQPRNEPTTGLITPEEPSEKSLPAATEARTESSPRGNAFSEKQSWPIPRRENTQRQQTSMPPRGEGESSAGTSIGSKAPFEGRREHPKGPLPAGSQPPSSNRPGNNVNRSNRGQESQGQNNRAGNQSSGGSGIKGGVREQRRRKGSRHGNNDTEDRT